MTRTGASPFVWPVLLASVVVAVLGSRTYVDLARVRVRLVTSDAPAANGAVVRAVRNHDQLGGLPVAVVARVRAAGETTQVTLALDERVLAHEEIPAGEEVRIDTSIDVFPADAGTIAVTGTGGGWVVSYLELATVHGYAGPPFRLVVAPEERRPASGPPWWILAPLFVVLVLARPRFGGWPARRGVRVLYGAVAAGYLLLLVASLVSPLLTDYVLLLAWSTVLFAGLVLYAEPLSRLTAPLRGRWIAGPGAPPALAPLPGLREVALAAAGMTALVCVVLHEQVLNLFSVPDLGDPLFSMWRMAWVQHQLIANPGRLFDANIFYPARATLAYSDSILLPSLMNWPLVALGLHRVVAYNLVFLSGFVMSGVAAYLLGRGIGWRPAAAWTTGAVFALYPFRIDHYSHLELQMAQWMPLAALGVYRLMAAGGWRNGALAVLALAAQWYSCMYYALFLTVFLAAVALALALSWRRRRQLLHVGVAIAIGTALALPLALAYTSAREEIGPRPVEAIGHSSARAADYLQPTARSAWYAGMNPEPAVSERQLFPGVAPVALAALGLMPPLDVTRLMGIAGGLVAFDGSLGLNGLLYPWLYEFLFPFQSVRVPARFAMLVGLALALLSGAGVHRLCAGATRTREWALLGVVTAGVAIDAWPRLELVPVWREPPPIYERLRSRDDAVLLEYPMNPRPEAFPENIPYLYFSTWHHTPMVNGYSGFSSPRYAGAAALMKSFPHGDTIDQLQRMGVTHISVVCALDRPFGRQGLPEGSSHRCHDTIRALDADPRLRLDVRATWDGAPALLYEVR